jgi:sugar/nucleoside kinase (ribokinase family)
MLERARSLGVSVYPVTAEKSRRSVVVVDTDGKRSVVNDLRGQFDKPYADAAHFAESGLVHVSLSSLQRDKTGAVSRLLSREAQKSLLSIDAGSVQALAAYGVEDLTALLSNGGVTLLLANEAEDAYLSEVIDPQILSEIPIRVAKHGAGDTIVTVGGVARSFPVAPCAVVDTTGAGDSFAGGMIAAWSLGSSLEEAVLLGHSVARITVETTGTLPDAARVRQQVGLSRFK